MTEPPTRKVFVEGRIPQVIYPGEVRCSSMSVESYVAFRNIPYARHPAGVKRYQVKSYKLILQTPLIRVCTLRVFLFWNSRLRKHWLQSIRLSWKRGPHQHPPIRPMRRGKYVLRRQPRDRLKALLIACTWIYVCRRWARTYEIATSISIIFHYALRIWFDSQEPDVIEELLPVLVFLHGGGFRFGSNDLKTYSPQAIVQEGVVFVSINYRLGLMGRLHLDPQLLCQWTNIYWCDAQVFWTRTRNNVRVMRAWRIRWKRSNGFEITLPASRETRIMWHFADGVPEGHASICIWSLPCQRVHSVVRWILFQVASF